MIEAETLAQNGKLDIPTEYKINTLLENHTNALNKALDKANTEDVSNKSETEDISTNFRAEMNAHARILDIINKKEGHKAEDKKQDSNINNVDYNINSNIKNNKKEEDKKDGEVSNTARTSAVRIKENIKQQEAKSEQVYIEKKGKIESLINTTDKNMEVRFVENNSSMNEGIITDTHKTLDEAKKQLEEADKKNKEGDSKVAYKSLLDSESSIKEVNIFLESHYKSEEENKNDR